MIEMWWECLYLFLCLCYPCGLPENSEGFSFSCIHVVTVVCSCDEVVLCLLNSFRRSGAERSARHCSFVIIIMLLKITAAL